MKVVILAGGMGTRISEESYLKPKPMIEIGGMPILWHIMKSYYYYGFDEFIICCGYKQNVIKEWFSNYFLHNSNITFDFTNGSEIIVHNQYSEKWKVTVVDTGLNTLTGSRLKRIKNFINNETFLMTYGDGVADVDILKLVQFHKNNNKLMTLTAVRPEGRFGVMDIDEEDTILEFREKSNVDAGWINGGFMVIEPEVLDYIGESNTMFEAEPMEKLAKDRQIACYKHSGFWQCMDTMRDKQKLEELWERGDAPWKRWSDKNDERIFL